MKGQFPQLLQELRQSKGISQARLALDLNYTQSNISCWENGSVEPKATALICLANYFNVSIDFLLGLEDDFGIRVVDTVSDAYTTEERNFIKDFRKLPKGMREILRTTLTAMLNDTSEEKI